MWGVCEAVVDRGGEEVLAVVGVVAGVFVADGVFGVDVPVAGVGVGFGGDGGGVAWGDGFDVFPEGLVWWWGEAVDVGGEGVEVGLFGDVGVGEELGGVGGDGDAVWGAGPVEGSHGEGVACGGECLGVAVVDGEGVVAGEVLGEVVAPFVVGGFEDVWVGAVVGEVEGVGEVLAVVEAAVGGDDEVVCGVDAVGGDPVGVGDFEVGEAGVCAGVGVVDAVACALAAGVDEGLERVGF